MFKDIMARFGKGSSRVDLVLSKTEIPLGERLEGELQLHGGSVDQTIQEIRIEFYFEIKSNEKVQTHLVAVIPYQASFLLRADQKRRVPFYLNIPTDLPLSNPDIRYYFITKLSIAGALDQTDQDEIKILPPERLERILHAFYQLGLKETSHSRIFNGETQEFYFTPTVFLADVASEIIFMVAMEPERVRLVLEMELMTTKEDRFVDMEVTLPNHLISQPASLVPYLQEALNHLASVGRKQNQKRKILGGIGGFAAEALGSLGDLFSKQSNQTVIGKFISQILGGDKK